MIRVLYIVKVERYKEAFGLGYDSGYEFTFRIVDELPEQLRGKPTRRWSADGERQRSGPITHGRFARTDLNEGLAYLNRFIRPYWKRKHSDGL